MTIRLDINPDLEKKIRQAADRNGITPDSFILDSVKVRLKQQRSRVAKPGNLTYRETQLLLQINQSLSPVDWQAYQMLLAKRRNETLTKVEQKRLVAIGNQIERLNVKRIRYVAKLAELQGSTLPAMVKKLGLTPTAHV